MSTKAKGKTKPLPLADILKDLAVLRAAGLNLAQVSKLTTASDFDQGSTSPVHQSVSDSYEFVQVSRAAIKLHDSGKVESQGNKIDQARQKYEDILDGLRA
ncbi:hypothetical protein CPB84DRAFT_1284465 [Gymnopilus junonius]|uniref:Uncharacterized protein n=1 Tax=Gymnopilus junonius TaxID=109634 RepID=A0A9P5NIB0_GYMJU|nr:hypothetical protein CPB84DRAFT_1284465 [Gymnopilus junonius]